MSIIATSVPPPEAPGAAFRGPAGPAGAVPGPLRSPG
jgi:hypothetical protein